MTKRGLLKKLNKYYNNKDNRISAKYFSCKHAAKCKRGCPSFSEAKEANVGEEYEHGTVPRLLFLSLDPGRSSKDPNERTVQGVRKADLEANLKPSNIHWKRTLEFAWFVFYELWKRQRSIKLSKDVKKVYDKINDKVNSSNPSKKLKKSYREFLKLYEELYDWGGARRILPYFAHTNSAKCSMNKERHAQADKELFNNCREYIMREIEILDPLVLVTQGKYASEVLEDAIENKGVKVKRQEKIRSIKYHPDTKCKRLKKSSNYTELQLNGKKIVWIRFDHPNHDRFNKKNKKKHNRHHYLDIAQKAPYLYAARKAAVFMKNKRKR